MSHEPYIPTAKALTEVEIVTVADLTEEQRERLNVCSRCGSLGDAACFDRRYKAQPHLTPVPTKRPHRERYRRPGYVRIHAR